MRIERLARHDQVHDLRRALEDAPDAHVADRHFDAGWPLAALVQRSCALIPAAAAHLQVVVEDSIERLGTEILGRRRLQPDVDVLAVGQRAGQVHHALHREQVRGITRDHPGDGLVLADRLAPLLPRGDPPASVVDESHADADGGSGPAPPADAPGAHGDLRALPGIAQPVSPGHPDVR